MKSTTFSLGNIALIDKADAQTGFFKSVFEGIGGKAKNFIPSIKLLMTNKLGSSVSVHKLLDFAPQDMLSILGFEGHTSDRTLNRTLERLGENSPLIIEKYQKWLKNNNLIDKIQNMDFSSSYFQGNNCPMAKLGYSRDHRPEKSQITYGVSIGANRIPTALTIQKGNVNDKKHMTKMIRLASRLLEPQSLLVFDCGGNTKENKEKILKKNLHYLTLKAKKKKQYQIAISYFKRQTPQKILHDEQQYYCVKKREGTEYFHIFYSEKLMHDQISKKQKKFEKSLNIGDKLIRKVEKGKELDRKICKDGWIISKGELQKTLDAPSNPYISGLEGYFILESSLDFEASEVLRLYKDRDKVEKFIRDIKEGAQMRPIRHWSKDAVLGYILLIFLTNALSNLTQILCNNNSIRNLKCLKKYLNNLTLCMIYPKEGFRICAIANISDEMMALFGDFLLRYGSFEPQVWG